ncbi:BtaA family protein [Thiorhodococcus mannitoliphagus]|uniref:BtaA family protein n=1 Tax=Thiorhodococcus mannitoliphagus TaxID=329406 RepID=A0A6P1DUK0_9GAMM|nr:BtaA family protein [Thiorhodococcus mannitoliphagus]NEX21150.1 BtaA family protein [Thiorhodococcus mannitoliphagus]
MQTSSNRHHAVISSAYPGTIFIDLDGERPERHIAGSFTLSTHPVRAKPTLSDRIDQRVFNAIYSRALVYNTCWEDPAVDRIALELKPDDTLLVITSAGCNVLDYALTGPRCIHAVDANPRQNALLELKLAGIRRLDHADFFAIFGHGYHPELRDIYLGVLRAELSRSATEFWDRRVAWFGNPNGSFYFHGLSGIVARLFHTYLKVRPRLAASVHALFESSSLDDQRRIYDTRVSPLIWTPSVKWTLSRQLTMSMLGVPHPQRKEVQAQHLRGVAGFVQEAIEYVFRQLPISSNYFWSVYLRGRYTEDCCPEYLKPDSFAALKDGLVDRILTHTSTVTDFLRNTEEPISKFVLLDHMDWMSSYYPDALTEEWEAILQRATADARIIFRSAHATPTYLDRIELGAERTPLRKQLRFHPELAQRLSLLDRVHTYAGFHIADVRA